MSEKKVRRKTWEEFYKFNKYPIFFCGDGAEFENLRIEQYQRNAFHAHDDYIDSLETRIKELEARNKELDDALLMVFMMRKQEK